LPAYRPAQADEAADLAILSLAWDRRDVTEHPFSRALDDYLGRPPRRPERRVGARSPGPCPSLSVTLVIGITSRPTFDPAPSDMLELTRDMRRMRTFSGAATMHILAS